MSNDKKNSNGDQPSSFDGGTIKPGDPSFPSSENQTSNEGAPSDYTTGQPESGSNDGNEGKRPAAKTEIIDNNASSSASERTDVIPSDNENSATEMFTPSKDSSNRILPGSGSGGKSPISSDERVRRLWDAAIGSKGSGETVRLEPPEGASDAILQRIAKRRVANANVDKSEWSDFDYVLKNKLGEGGMGIVYSATQTTMNREVALKTLTKPKDNDKIKQFYREAEITSKLDHPNITPIYELGVTPEGTYFYTMKLIEGTDLQGSIHRLGMEKKLEIFEKISDAIGFAHSRDIVHLDIKPLNIMVGGFGEVYVTDWGLAHDMTRRDEQGNRVPPPVGGTPDYMAPEMALSDKSKVGKPTDIYLLGALLFQIVTGKPPHDGGDAKDKRKAHKLINARHNRIRETNIDHPLLKVALKAMSTELDDRYTTVEDMQGAIREIIEESNNIQASEKLTKDSKTTAELAEKTQDYERFNRAIFGFQNAIEVWTGNKEAEVELKKARLAFGKIAFAKGDYDLVLQTLDRGVADEATLLDKAKSARNAALNRESRLKFMRNAVIGLLGIGALGATGSAIVFNNLYRTAGLAQKKAELAQYKETKEREKAELAQKKAEDEQKKAELAQKKETEEREKAVAALAKVTVGKQLSQLSIASAQADQNSPLDAKKSLGNLEKLSADELNVLKNNLPKFKENWAANRVALLSNADVAKGLRDLNGVVTAIDFAQGRNIGIAGLSDGTVVKLEFKDGKLVEQVRKQIPGAKRIQAASLSPSADEAIFAIEGNARGEYSLYRWGLSGEVEPMKEEKTGNRYFQKVAYNPSGTMKVAGNRGGIWVMRKGSDWQELAKTNEETNEETIKKTIKKTIKGELLDIDWLDDQSLVVLAQINKDGIEDRYLYLIQSVDTSGSAEPTMLVNKEPRITQVGVVSKTRLLIASEGGSLATYELSDSSLTNPKPLRRVHQRDIDQIDVASNGRIVTGSREEVAHVWKIQENGEVAYETFATATPSEKSTENTIARSVFIDGSHLVNVDNQGSAIALDIERQIQRRQLKRADPYKEKVVGIHARGESSEALSVDANGAVDLWDLVTGKTQPVVVGEAGNEADNSVARYSYFGHTPGANLFDTAIDMDQQVVVTVAVLPSTESVSAYVGKELPDANTFAWVEFCVWDQESGNMKNRWQFAMAKPVQPRLTLLGNGQFYIGGQGRENDTAAQPTICDYQGRVVEEQSNGASFAAVNPKNPELVAMWRISRGGLGWLWDRKAGQESSTMLPNKEMRFIVREAAPVHAVWSTDGERLYVLDTSGNITPFILQAEKNSVRRSSTDAIRLTEFDGADKDAGFLAPLRSFQDVELAVLSHGGTDRVICYVRDTSKKKTWKFTSNVGDNGNKVAEGASKPSNSVEKVDRLVWLNDAQEGYDLPKPEEVLSQRRGGDRVYVSMKKSGRVYAVSSRGEQPLLFGRRKLLMSTSDREGKKLMTLQEDGSIEVLDLDPKKPEGSQWKRAKYKAAPSEKRIALSPDGTKLAVYDSDAKKLRVLFTDKKTPDGNNIMEGILAFEWNPDKDKGADLVTLDDQGNLRLVTLDDSGKLQIEGEVQQLPNIKKYFENKKSMEMGSEKIESEKKECEQVKFEDLIVRRLAFFNEPWSNSDKAAKYFLVQVEDKCGKGRLLFVPRPAEEGQDEKKETDRIYEVSLDSEPSALAVSPVDPIIAVGNSTGLIRIYFASPTYESFSQVSDLKGSAKILQLAFSGDGNTLVSSDEKKEVSAWMSTDRLQPKE